MAKKSKKYIEALNQIEKGKAYTKEEAVELVKKLAQVNLMVQLK